MVRPVRHRRTNRQSVQLCWTGTALRLLETFDLGDLHVAVKTALRMGTIGFDAIKHLVLCQVEKRPPKLDLDVYPYLPRANVGTTSAASYMCLMAADAP